MPSLVQMLLNRDLGLLQVFFYTWGINLESPVERSQLSTLLDKFIDKEKIRGMLDALPAEATDAMVFLVQSGGRVSWAIFTRKYGELREWGQVKRERERPFEQDNASTVEYLWYRGLIGKDFFDTATGPLEFAYIPDDIKAAMHVDEAPKLIRYGYPQKLKENDIQLLTTDFILENACTLLAGLRNEYSNEQIEKMFVHGDESLLDLVKFAKVTPDMLNAILAIVGFTTLDKKMDPSKVGEFLGKTRGEVLLCLVNGWLESQEFNELKLLAGLEFEGEWRNQPKDTRKFLVELIMKANQDLVANFKDDYLSISAFTKSIKENHPDFQRPAADYDSWFIKDKQSGKYLRGFENWDSIDGRLIRFIVTGPMFWLGLVDLVASRETIDGDIETKITGFRISSWGQKLLNNRSPDIVDESKHKIQLSSNGIVRTPMRIERRVRYQLSRFCSWEGIKSDYYIYRLRPEALDNARKQGLLVKHFVRILSDHIEIVPPNILRALRDWEKNGSQAKLEKVIVLRVRNPDILRKLRNSKANRFLGDPLGPTTITIKERAQEKVLSFLTEIGYLGETSFEE